MKRNILSQRHCYLLIAITLIACAPAVAQHTGDLGGNWNNPGGGTITAIIVDRYARRPAKRTGANSPPARSSSSATSGAKLDDASLHFRSTGTQLKTREIADLIDAGNPQVLTLMTTILQEYEKGTRATGRSNDLALALSFFLATNASVYHDGGQPSDPQMFKLRETVAEALIEGNALKDMSDRQKQEMYEVLVLFTGFTLAVYQEGKQGNNSETVKTSQQLAGQNLLAVVGISPDKINFTDQGLSIEAEPVVATAPVMQSPAEPSPSQNLQMATINAGKLVLDFEGNEVRAIQLYAGKRIRVNGIVNSIDVLKDGRITLTFHSPAGGYAMTRTVCCRWWCRRTCAVAWWSRREPRSRSTWASEPSRSKAAPKPPSRSRASRATA